MLNILLILDVLVAIGLGALILLQRGPGATAGAAFGSGASGTVFGARGSANFLTRATAVLAAAFFLITMVMAMVAARQAGLAQDGDLGVMAALPNTETTITLPAGDGEVPTMTLEAGDDQAAEGMAEDAMSAGEVMAEGSDSMDAMSAEAMDGDAAMSADAEMMEQDAGAADADDGNQ